MRDGSMVLHSTIDEQREGGADVLKRARCTWWLHVLYR